MFCPIDFAVTIVYNIAGYKFVVGGHFIEGRGRANESIGWDENVN
ncbi:hypothetical protein FACS1894198_3370 [Clostridia bacterium]|nr:hypothetical protein FACS1894198_3370 [Clostridia bacterium]